MPLFDFICRACGNEFEALVMGSSQPTCPRCSSTELAKQMSTFAVRTGGKADAGQVSGSGSKCSGCAGGSCSSCH